MVGYQASGAAPFLRGAPVESPETVATAFVLVIHKAGIMQKQLYVIRRLVDELQDSEILEAQRLLSMYEGVFVEPASAASIGGAIRDIKAGKIAEGSVIVCTVTGNGLKDPDTAIKQCADAVMLSIDATMDQVKDSILSNM
jgi:threonine synthase